MCVCLRVCGFTCVCENDPLSNFRPRCNLLFKRLKENRYLYLNLFCLGCVSCKSLQGIIELFVYVGVVMVMIKY